VTLSAAAALRSHSEGITDPAGVSSQHVTAHNRAAVSATKATTAGHVVPSFPLAMRLDLQQSSTANRLNSRRVQLCQFRELTLVGVHS